MISVELRLNCPLSIVTDRWSEKYSESEREKEVTYVRHIRHWEHEVKVHALKRQHVDSQEPIVRLDDDWKFCMGEIAMTLLYDLQ